MTIKDQLKVITTDEFKRLMNNQYHGIVVVKVENGKIKNWREYHYKSELEWSEFKGKNDF
jgi:hypothetical protein